MTMKSASAQGLPGTPPQSNVQRLVEGLAGQPRGRVILASLDMPAEALGSGPEVSRAQLALALAALLFEDVQRRVPMARAYVEDAVRGGRRLVFDHGALRTVKTRAGIGGLPGGAEAFARILEPLGYERRGTYPLERLGMTGYAYCHADLPEEIPQYFVSELHPERFSPAFQAAVERVIGTAVDPLSADGRALLDQLAGTGSLPADAAAALLPELVRMFDRHHEEACAADYETLLAESAEMAWISTEGNAFNHATDRVDDVFAVAEAQKAIGRPMKETVEVSRNGNVMQTAFRAATRQALLRSADGHMVVRDVPGSFHEFITRKRLADGSLDLTFDAGNATSIFSMTRAPKESA